MYSASACWRRRRPRSSSRSRHSRRTLPTQRSAWARASGARTGALMTWMPSERQVTEFFVQPLARAPGSWSTRRIGVLDSFDDPLGRADVRTPLPLPRPRANGRARTLARAPTLAVRVRSVPGEVDTAQGRDVDRSLELLEQPRSTRERDPAGVGREVQLDVAIHGVGTAGVDNDIAVQRGEDGSVRVHDGRPDRNRREVRGGDRAVLTGEPVVVRALLRYVKSSTPLNRRGGARIRHDSGSGDSHDERQGARHLGSPFSVAPGCPMPISSATTIRANGTPATSFASLTSSTVSASKRQKHESSAAT